VAVSKGVPAGRLRAATAAGLDLFGENRVQEAATKVGQLPSARWHLVGRLQANKARRAGELFSAIHSVDSLDLAQRLDRLAGELRDAGLPLPWRDRLPVYLQANVDEDPAKAGFAPATLEEARPRLAGLAHLELLGLMTVGRLVARPEEARATFLRLRQLSERLRACERELAGGLSMGMTDDFEVAVEEGATVVRIGRALFGERSPD
jgi:pyridoxal phosphate enzyme (YggS family)